MVRRRARIGEALEHLFFECVVAMQFMQHVPAWVDHATRCAVGANLSDPRDVILWLAAAGNLLKHLNKCRSSLENKKMCS